MLIKLRLLKVPANKQIIVPALKRNTAEMDSTQWTTFPYTYSVLLTSDSVADIWRYTSLSLGTPHSRLNTVYVCMCVCMYVWWYENYITEIFKEQKKSEFNQTFANFLKFLTVVFPGLFDAVGATLAGLRTTNDTCSTTKRSRGKWASPSSTVSLTTLKDNIENHKSATTKWCIRGNTLFTRSCQELCLICWRKTKKNAGDQTRKWHEGLQL